MEPTLKVSEIFYSLQGEGARAGDPSIFIRLQGCSAKHACFAKGIICDTEFESGHAISISELSSRISKLTKAKPEWIVWTGGEPLDQLTPEIARVFSSQGYKQAIETSGIKVLDGELAQWLDHIVCSPKVAEHVLVKHFPELPHRDKINGHSVNVDELRYVRHSGQPGPPEPSLKAKYYYVSPHSDGENLSAENLHHCIDLCLENPQWRLSVQMHKLWRVL